MSGLTCEAGLADALVVVGQLDAVEAVGRAAGVGQTLVDVALAPLTREAGRAVAAVSAHFVHAGAVVEALGRSAARPQRRCAVVLVDLAEDAWGRQRLLSNFDCGSLFHIRRSVSESNLLLSNPPRWFHYLMK